MLIQNDLNKNCHIFQARHFHAGYNRTNLVTDFADKYIYFRWIITVYYFVENV